MNATSKSLRESHRAEWFAWKAMKSRCSNPNNRSYPNYGGRGIRVCERWKRSFAAFIEDMGPRPDGYSLERRDVNGNYEPSNCDWIPLDAQRLNRTDSALITAFGETKNHSLWEQDERCLVSRRTFRTRLEKGWSPEAALATPPTSFSEAGKRGKGISKRPRIQHVHA